jgi:hypothetical protein
MNTTPSVIPIPRCNITIRPAVPSDLPFIDSLQRIHSKQVGWMPRMQLEGKINRGHVIVAEEGSGLRVQGSVNGSASEGSLLSPEHRDLSPVGYCIGTDQYFKRDDVGIIYQMNVVPSKQRGLIGATLVKAMFERAAYGCKLFCCWCAQDIEANHFWESLGFIPLAFRAGSRGNQRVHIFWQRRIRAGDETTPYWFPSQTSSGSIREDRLVFPIPPGTHWSDAKPIILPALSAADGRGAADDTQKQLPSSRKKNPKAPAVPPSTIAAGGLRFAAMKETAIELQSVSRERSPRQKVKNDPRFVAAARELRDRWLERVNADTSASLAHAKYDISRELLDQRMGGDIRPALPALIAA